MRLRFLLVAAALLGADLPGLAAARWPSSTALPRERLPALPAGLPRRSTQLAPGKPVYSVAWGGRRGVLKLNASEREAVLQQRARRILREAGIAGVDVPRVLGYEDSLLFQEEHRGHSLNALLRADEATLARLLPSPIQERDGEQLRRAFHAWGRSGLSHNDALGLHKDMPNVRFRQSGGRTRFAVIDWEHGAYGERWATRLDAEEIDELLSILRGLGRLR